MTRISLDIIEAMCPSITCNMVAKAINFFSKGLEKGVYETIEDCLKMIKFWIRNTHPNFAGKYYEYGGLNDINECGLTIGGYRSAWLAESVASYLLSNSTKLFDKTTIYHGIYIDRVIFFEVYWSNDDTNRRLKTFQIKVNNLCGSDGLNFTAEIWRCVYNEICVNTSLNKQTTIIKGKYFLFLDGFLFWSFHNKLSFNIYMKPNQKLKYLNRDSFYTNKCFEAIFSMDFYRLSNLLRNVIKQ